MTTQVGDGLKYKSLWPRVVGSRNEQDMKTGLETASPWSPGVRRQHGRSENLGPGVKP